MKTILYKSNWWLLQAESESYWARKEFENATFNIKRDGAISGATLSILARVKQDIEMCAIYTLMWLLLSCKEDDENGSR